MSKQPFSGIYAQHLKEFVALKQSLGYKYTRASVCLDDFDRFTQTRGEHTLGISRELSDAFCAKRPYESNSTRILRVSTLRVFSAYLCNLGIRSFIPPPCTCGRGAYIPYVFSRDEIKKVFSACDTLVSGRKCKHLNLFAMPALLRFLYATGIRIGEAVSLKSRDVDLVGHHAVIRDSKNGKERLVPLSDSLVLVCKEYVQHRDALPVGCLSGFFFTTLNGKQCSHESVRWWFRKILQDAAIPYQGRSAGPRIHSLRHSFATHSLAQVAETGKDLYSLLPHLSAFLGHESLNSTNAYIRLTAEMYPALIHGFDQEVILGMFPEINFNNDETE